ncbi:MAG: hypothetical protein D6706_20570 [Chloroflexi bacterium]|nr:MAG: hypothetical protein D6706_20570 [Chloroflexota bacterium]
MPDRDVLGVVSGGVLLALVLTRLLHAPVRPFFQVSVLGSPVRLFITGGFLTTLIVLGLTITGMYVLLRTHPLIRKGEVEPHLMSWILPALFNVAMLNWLSRMPTVIEWTAVFLLAIPGITFAFVVAYASLDSVSRQLGFWQRAQMTIIWLSAIILFTVIYDTRWRSLLSATAVFVVGTLLAARFFWIYRWRLADVFAYGLVVGSGLGQLTWALNYWRLSALKGGMVLMLVFYVATGLIQHSFREQLGSGEYGRSLLLEYGSVTIVGLLLIKFFVP